MHTIPCRLLKNFWLVKTYLKLIFLAKVAKHIDGEKLNSVFTMQSYLFRTEHNTITPVF